mmetsp:Transcript_2032/g.5335  ORF Transcript_2032/g.5335 Transcript_2032/m.5335 type:complete len:254 (-) Transcript_2032:1028-1789(-)
MHQSVVVAELMDDDALSAVCIHHDPLPGKHCLAAPSASQFRHIIDDVVVRERVDAAPAQRALCVKAPAVLLVAAVPIGHAPQRRARHHDVAHVHAVGVDAMAAPRARLQLMLCGKGVGQQRAQPRCRVTARSCHARRVAARRERDARHKHAQPGAGDRLKPTPCAARHAAEPRRIDLYRSQRLIVAVRRGRRRRHLHLQFHHVDDVDSVRCDSVTVDADDRAGSEAVERRKALPADQAEEVEVGADVRAHRRV